jgi:cytochrome P450
VKRGLGDIRTAPVPAGASGMRVLRYGAQMLRDPLATYGVLQRNYGDAVRVPLSRNHMFFLLDRPEYVEHVLVQHQDRYARPFTYQPLKPLLGDGLVTAEGAVSQRRRGLVQPVFRHRHLQSFAPAIVEATRNRVAQWAPGITIDIAAEMRTLTMEVIGRVLFGTDLAGDAAPVGRAVTRLQSSMAIAAILATVVPPERLLAVATRIVPGLGRAWQTVEPLITRIIEARAAAPHDEPSDLLDLLLAAGQDEQPLSRAEIQDEVMTLVLVGHETTANALTWALTLLSRHPAAYERLVAEVDDVLGGRDPQGPDINALPWAQAVVSETMRLYPPVWQLRTRRCARRRHIGRPGFRRRHRWVLTVPSSPPSRILAQPKEIRPATILIGQRADPSAVCVSPVRRRSPHLRWRGTGLVGGDASAGRHLAVCTRRPGADSTPAGMGRRHAAPERTRASDGHASSTASAIDCNASDDSNGSRRAARSR